MRIVIANRVLVGVGGVEEYIRRITPQLAQRGHELAFLCEHTAPGESIAGAFTTWNAREGLDALRAWAPDVIYCNGFGSTDNERRLARVAPSVYSAHGYFGTCVSGHKMHAFPERRVCRKTFGPACLVHYLPRRCGGLSPVTMLRQYRVEHARLDVIRTYSSVVVHSRYMQEEYRHHGIETIRVPYSHPIQPWSRHPLIVEPSSRRRLLFLGRLVTVKGVDILLDAAAEAARWLPGIELTIAGNGNERSQLERQALRIARKTQNLSIHFVGRVNEDQRNALLMESHALVVPSVWPEPFGMVGPEAGAFGVPSIAFNVGGIPEWLDDGVSGCLAQPPSASAFARAIVRCLGDADTHRRLAEGARLVYERLIEESTVTALEHAFALARERFDATMVPLPISASLLGQ